ncbi:unnamed protein product [Arctogadus glacialis]
MDEFRASVGLSVGFPAADTLEETSDSGGSLASSWPLRAPEDAQCERRGTPTLPYPTLLPSEELLRGTGAPYRPGAALTSARGPHQLGRTRPPYCVDGHSARANEKTARVFALCDV